ncbi:MAG: VOC family protein [Gemmatimonadales bacterium]
MPIDPIPAGHHTVTPYLLVEDVARQIDFMARAFGAVETGRFATPDGRIMHAEVRIGDSFVMLGEASGEWKPMPCMLHLFVPDIDAVYARAMKAGAKSVREPSNQFYGDRSGGVVDAEGNQWWIATHLEDVSPEELERRMREQAGG